MMNTNRLNINMKIEFSDKYITEEELNDKY